MSEYLPGLAGVPATKSNISDIDGEKGILAYRGYPIEELAEHSSFEETTLLLLDGRLPSKSELDDFSQQITDNRQLKFYTRGLMKNLPPTVTRWKFCKPWLPVSACIIPLMNASQVVMPAVI